MQETILILDFGSQYTQLIARRIRELNVYCEIHPYNHFPKPNSSVKGIILSGSPHSVKEIDAPEIDLTQFIGKLPILGVCYGAQYIADRFGGEVLRSQIREYGRSHLQTKSASRLLNGMPDNSQIWMSHGDSINSVPEGYVISAATEDIPVAAFENESQQVYAIQFHPEVTHSTDGKVLLAEFRL
jgi:GMP synthase (glutamine-hydrolysing)